MKIIEPGHIYEFNNLDGSLENNKIIFVNREPGTEHPGTQTQEVLRALIDRTQHCDRCLRWKGNDKIIYHLRMALVYHEARALLRKTKKGKIKPEEIVTGPDGHFVLVNQNLPPESDDFQKDNELLHQDSPIGKLKSDE